MTYEPTESPDLSAVRAQLDAIAPPMSPDLTADAMTATGRRSRRRHRIARAALGAVATAVVTALAIVLIGPGTHSQPPPDAAEQPAFPLPSLDPKGGYTWIVHGPAETTEQTARLTDGLWAALATRADLHVAARDGASTVPVTTRADFPEAYRLVRALGDPHGGGDLYRQPFYELGPDVALTLPGDERIALFSAEVVPSGGYLGGDPAHPSLQREGVVPQAPFSEPNCAAPPPGYTYACSETTGPRGERVVRAAVSIEAPADGPSAVESVTVFQPNGNALRLSVSVGRITRMDGGADTASPFLTVDELTAIAVAVPEVAVR